MVPEGTPINTRKSPSTESEISAETSRAAAPENAAGLLPARGRADHRTEADSVEANTVVREERELREIVDLVPHHIAVAAPDGTLILGNRVMLDYYGLTTDDLRDAAVEGLARLMHPDDRAPFLATWERGFASTVPWETETRFQNRNGEYRWFLVRGTPLFDDGGRIVRWYITGTDIEDRKKAEDKIRQDERELRLLFDVVPQHIVVLDVDGRVLHANRASLEFFGFCSTEELTDPEKVGGRYHPDDVAKIVNTARGFAAGAPPPELEVRILRQDGQYRWYLIRYSALRDDEGRVVRWYATGTDIDDRKRAEDAIRRAYESFATAQRLSKTGNFTADILADHHTWSEELYRIYEVDPAAKPTFSALRRLVHPDDLPSYDAALARSLDGSDFDLVFRIVTRSGTVKHLHAVAQVEDYPLFIGGIQDVTERRVAEEALNRARTELARVMRVATAGALTASIAHEVNQPLSGIITNASTCLRMLDANPPNIDGARETARRTIRDGNRASDVIARLRELFSRKEFTLESMDLNEATREVIALSLTELQRNRVVLQSELDEDLPTITGDRVQLQQVILNLLRNASDAMADVNDRPRQLLIRTEQEDGDRVRLTVRDAGVGVDPQSVNRLFDAFHTTKSGGMGIGLFISRSIVERHGGRLWAEPNDGPGATFSFSIPRALENAL